MLPTSLRLDVAATSPAAPAGVANRGYWGIPVKRDTRYRASFWARAAQPTRVVPVTRRVSGVKPSFLHTFPPHSITVLRLDTR